MFEDALSGVAAGRAGHFGFVVGVDRVGQAEALRRNGADVVVTDLAELLHVDDHRGRLSRRALAGARDPLDLDLLAQSESVFALSNGHIGLRGNLDEGEPHGLPGTYLNSFYEIRPLPYAEAGYGYPEAGQTVVDVTNGKIIRLLVDDEPFDVRYGELHRPRADSRPARRHADPPRALALARRQAGRSGVDPAGVAGATQRRRHRVRGRGGRRIRPRHSAVRARRQRGPAGDVGRPAGVGHPGQPAGGRRARIDRPAARC